MFFTNQPKLLYMNLRKKSFDLVTHDLGAFGQIERNFYVVFAKNIINFGRLQQILRVSYAYMYVVLEYSKI